MRLLVTGFGAFGEFDNNPSSLLAPECGCEHCVLEVSFKAVDAFLAGLDPESFDALLMLGVAGKAEAMRVETVARNWIGPVLDVRGERHGPGLLDPAAPPRLAATLWPAELLADAPLRAASIDAGDYLCNYLFFRALQAFPDKRVGFLHVPPVSVVAIEEQQRMLGEVVAEL